MFICGHDSFASHMMPLFIFHGHDSYINYTCVGSSLYNFDDHLYMDISVLGLSLFDILFYVSGTLLRLIFLYFLVFFNPHPNLFIIYLFHHVPFWSSTLVGICYSPNQHFFVCDDTCIMMIS